MEKFDVAIIGAGVIGTAILRELSKYKLKICILEKESDVASKTSKANSGIIHAGFDAENGSLKAKLNVLGSKLTPEICRDLNVKYKNNEALVVAFSDEEISTLQVLQERGEKNGVKTEIISGQEVFELEPNLSREIKGALRVKSSAICCPYELTVALCGNAMDNGASLFTDFEVVKINNDDEKFTIISKDNAQIEARYIVNSAGLKADDVGRLFLDESIKIQARKGEYLILDKDCGGLINRTIFTVPTKMGKGILMTPTVDGNLLVGPTSEDVLDKDDFSTTLTGAEKIKIQVKKELPNIDFRKIISSFAGNRAVGNTGDFIVEMSKTCKNVLNIAGIDSPGLSSAVAIASYGVDILKNNGLILDLKENFIATRKADDFFQKMTIDEKNELIKKDKSFGKVVCRCEGITEGEIVYAINTNPKATNLDAVKRRTRSGMGRCQGGFCSTLIVEILSRELSKDILEITKFGKGSYINVSLTKEKIK